MTTATRKKIRVDMDELTGLDLIAIEEATGKPLTEVLGTAAGIFAAGWRARVNNGEPDATYEDTLTLRMADFDMAGDTPGNGNGASPGKAASGNSGGTPRNAPERGD